ncbi:MAG TPA: histidine triad nucleotide-binding protein [Candidatus Limnocylindria bacterium]|nr:histidine triad nucleotide-binding protein [Candidatus Limnocylindria bacterium]
MADCLFCRIARGEIPCAKVMEDGDVLAFRDIHPQARVHVLVIPKVHMDGLGSLGGANDALLARLLRAADEVARLEGIAQSGYRLVSNCGPDACQSVGHLHFHVLGGQQLSDRMA